MGGERGSGRGGRLFEFEIKCEGGGMGWALINFYWLQDRRLFEVDANSRLGAYSNKYGMYGYKYRAR